MKNEPNKPMTKNKSVELNINKSENLSNQISESIESNSIEINEEIVNISNNLNNNGYTTYKYQLGESDLDDQTIMKIDEYTQCDDEDFIIELKDIEANRPYIEVEVLVRSGFTLQEKEWSKWRTVI